MNETDLDRFSRRYLQIISDITGKKPGSDPCLPLALREALSDLFKSFSVQEYLASLSPRPGRAFHFGLIEGGMTLLRASTLFVNELLLQDIIYRYAIVASDDTGTSRQRYVIVGDETYDKLVRSLASYCNGILSMEPFINQGVIHVVPHPAMYLSDTDLNLATSLSEAFLEISRPIYQLDPMVDRLMNHIAIGSEHFKAIPFTNWREGLQFIEDKMALMAVLSRSNKAPVTTAQFIQEHSKVHRSIEDSYKLSLIPEVLRRFEYVDEFVKAKMAAGGFEDLFELRETYSGFREDFFQLVEQIQRAKGKWEMQEIADAAEEKIRKEMSYARTVVKAWKGVKTVCSLTSIAIAYVSLNLIGSILSIPTLWDRIKQMQDAYDAIRFCPNQVVLLLKELEPGWYNRFPFRHLTRRRC